MLELFPFSTRGNGKVQNDKDVFDFFKEMIMLVNNRLKQQIKFNFVLVVIPIVFQLIFNHLVWLYTYFILTLGKR